MTPPKSGIWLPPAVLCVLFLLKMFKLAMSVHWDVFSPSRLKYEDPFLTIGDMRRLLLWVF